MSENLCVVRCAHDLHFTSRKLGTDVTGLPDVSAQPRAFINVTFDIGPQFSGYEVLNFISTSVLVEWGRGGLWVG